MDTNFDKTLSEDKLHVHIINNIWCDKSTFTVFFKAACNLASSMQVFKTDLNIFLYLVFQMLNSKKKYIFK